ncbi:hypothetical protein K0I59_004434, partial [Vibrio vulnificus]|nr:hypothetical protein [Vibrio vulnificus]
MSTPLNSLLFNLESFEPEKIPNKKTYSWKNPKLSPTLTRDLEVAKTHFVGLKTDNDVANILEVPVGQLLHILYYQKQNYNSFTIKKKSGKTRLIDSP